MKTITLALIAGAMLGAVPTTAAGQGHRSLADLEAGIAETLDASGARYAVAYRDLRDGEEILINPDLEFHAASTMKTPIMIRLYRMADAGQIQIDARIPVTNRFISIFDGSPYELTTDDDSELGLYDRIGERVSVRELIELMIAYSSNLATNILVDLADPEAIDAMLSAYGAEGMKVRRGVEDIPAYRHGLNNTTTARGLLEMFTALAGGRMASATATAEMIEILLIQEFNEMIPAGLPAGTPVAHKTGWITGVDHDGGIVEPYGAWPYVLVILTDGVEEEAVTRAAGAEVSRLIWEWRN